MKQIRSRLAWGPRILMTMLVILLVGCGTSDKVGTRLPSSSVSDSGNENEPTYKSSLTGTISPSVNGLLTPASDQTATYPVGVGGPFLPIPSIAGISSTPVSVASPAPVPSIESPVTSLRAHTPEQARADELLESEWGVYGFVVLDPDGSVVVSRNGVTPFVTASTYKLILMADIFRRIEDGELSIDQYVPLDAGVVDDDDNYFSYDEIWSERALGEYLFAVGAYSSNAAARTLLAFTSTEELRQTASDIGMERTYLFAYPEELPYWPPQVTDDTTAEDVEMARAYLEQSASDGPINITTPLDMAKYNLAVANGDLFSPWISAQIEEILSQQVIRDRLPVYISDSYRVIDKPGNLPDAVNDVGVIFLEDGPRAVAMLSQAVPDPDRATFILQRLGVIAAGWEDIPPMPDYWEDNPNLRIEPRDRNWIPARGPVRYR